LKLHVHTAGEIWLGAALGLATSYTAMVLLF